MVQLQRLTASRSGELVLMRMIDRNTTSRIWTYTPLNHKNAYRALDGYLFSPAEAERRKACMRVANICCEKTASFSSA